MSDVNKEARVQSLLGIYRGLALGVSAYLIGAHLWTWILFLPIFTGGRADFRQLYSAGYMVRTGHAHQLYDYDSQLSFQNSVVSKADAALPFIRPAYQALLFVPFSLLPYRSAYFAFLLVNLVALIACYWLLRPHFGDLTTVYRWLPGALFLAFLPVGAALIQGQDSILLLLILGGTFTALQNDKHLLAGSVLALGLFKFQIALPVAFLFALWKEWRFVKGFLMLGVVLGAISTWMVGVGTIVAYPVWLIHLRYPLEISRMPNLHGLMFWLLGGSLRERTVTTASILLTLAGFYLVWRSNPESSAKRFLLALVAAALGSYYLFIHDLTVLLIPLLVVLGRCLQAEAAERNLIRIAALTFVAPLLYSYAPGHFCLVALPISAFMVAMAQTPYPLRR